MNLALLVLEARFHFLPSVWIMFIIVLYEGLLGGACYVNAFYRISKEVHCLFVLYIFVHIPPQLDDNFVFFSLETRCILPYKRKSVIVTFLWNRLFCENSVCDHLNGSQYADIFCGTIYTCFMGCFFLSVFFPNPNKFKRHFWHSLGSFRVKVNDVRAMCRMWTVVPFNPDPFTSMYK